MILSIWKPKWPKYSCIVLNFGLPNLWETQSQNIPLHLTTKNLDPITKTALSSIFLFSLEKLVFFWLANEPRHRYPNTHPQNICIDVHLYLKDSSPQIILDNGF